MNIIKKQRITFTLSMTLIAAIFLLVMLGGMFGLVCAVNNVYVANCFDKALQSPFEYNQNATQDMQAIFIFVKDDNIVTTQVETVTQDLLEDIVNGAINQSEGKFNIGNRYFIVQNKDFADGVLYAVFDRTSQHEQLVNTAIVEVLLYLCSIVLVVLLSLLSSAKLLHPVAIALKKQRDFITNTSHELKTPLTVISTNLSVIKSEPHSTVEENEKWIASIDSQIVLMQELINSMLELSKLEHSITQMQEIDFSSLTEGVCLTFEAVCFEKNVELRTDIQNDIRLVGSSQSLERLVAILLDNAIKYCGDNGRVGVKLTTDAKKAHLAVINTGEVISKEDAQHVFDRFYRTDGARNNKDSHSFGLGLSIAAATVAAHGGNISCHGIPDKGTVFDVYIPLKQPKMNLNKLKL